MLVCLDLEKTLIDDWHDVTLCPSTKVLLEQYGVTDGFPVEIFSFAVDNQKDIVTFNELWLESVERMFNISVEHVNSVERLMALCPVRMTMGQFKQRGKRESFLEYVRWCENQNALTDLAGYPTSYLLFDDLVDDEDILLDNCSVHFIRV